MNSTVLLTRVPITMRGYTSRRHWSHHSAVYIGMSGPEKRNNVRFRTSVHVFVYQKSRLCHTVACVNAQTSGRILISSHSESKIFVRLKKLCFLFVLYCCHTTWIRKRSALQRHSQLPSIPLTFYYFTFLAQCLPNNFLTG